MSSFSKYFIATTIIVSVFGGAVLTLLNPPNIQKKEDAAKDEAPNKYVRTSALDGVYFPKVLNEQK